MSYVKLPKLGSNRLNTNNLNPNKYDTKNIRDIAENKNDEAIIYEAIQVGYLLYPSKEFIWQAFSQQVDFDAQASLKLVRRPNRLSRFYDEFYENDYSKIFFLNLSKVPLVEVGDLFICNRLTILNLSNNFLVNIEPLAECVNLFRLDLQNNQLDKLPDEEFWSSMTKLKVLYLHGNTISRLEYLKQLSYCPALEILTLYDSPISLKYNYRHHTVNSIITLKALDDYVISDEEIIEEAKFNNMFSARSANFKINLVVPTTQENSFKSELLATYELIKRVNKILAHNSPVLITQRLIKGYLARRKYKKYLEAKKIAAVIKIQKWWRKNKSKILKKKYPHRMNVKHNLPFEENSDIQNSNTTSSFLTDYKNKLKDSKRNNTPTSANIKRNIIIDLNKLHKRQTTFLEENLELPRLTTMSKPVTAADRRAEPQIAKIKSAASTKDEIIMHLFREKKLEPNKLIAISRMLSSLNERFDNDQLIKDLNYDLVSMIVKEALKKNSKENHTNKLDKENQNSNNEIEYDDSIYRLPILKSNNSIIKTKDNYIVDLVKEKFVGFNAIKKMEAEGHKKIEDIKSIPTPAEHEFLTNDQRVFQKIYGNMGLGCLRAVDKAYEERSQIDKGFVKQKNCENSKDSRKFSQQQVNYFREDRIKEAHDEYIKEKTMQKIAKDKADKEFDDLKQRVKEKREKMLEFKKRRRRDIMLAIDFSKQHLSVSKALQRHEYLTAKDNHMKKNTEFVSEHKTQQENQHEIVKKYIEQRTALRLMQSNNEKKILRKRLKDDIEGEETQAKMRVEYLRSLGPLEIQPLKSNLFNFLPPGYYDYEYDNNFYVIQNNTNYDINTILEKIDSHQVSFHNAQKDKNGQITQLVYSAKNLKTSSN